MRYAIEYAYRNGFLFPEDTPNEDIMAFYDLLTNSDRVEIDHEGNTTLIDQNKRTMPKLVPVPEHRITRPTPTEEPSE